MTGTRCTPSPGTPPRPEQRQQAQRLATARALRAAARRSAGLLCRGREQEETRSNAPGGTAGMNSVYMSQEMPVVALASRESTRDARQLARRLRGSGPRSGAFAIHGDRRAGWDAPGLAVTMAAAITRTLRCGRMGNLSLPAARSGRCLVLAGCGESARRGQRRYSSATEYVAGGRRDCCSA